MFRLVLSSLLCEPALPFWIEEGLRQVTLSPWHLELLPLHILIQLLRREGGRGEGEREEGGGEGGGRGRGRGERERQGRERGRGRGEYEGGGVRKGGEKEGGREAGGRGCEEGQKTFIISCSFSDQAQDRLIQYFCSQGINLKWIYLLPGLHPPSLFSLPPPPLTNNRWLPMFSQLRTSPT